MAAQAQLLLFAIMHYFEVISFDFVETQVEAMIPIILIEFATKIGTQLISCELVFANIIWFDANNRINDFEKIFFEFVVTHDFAICPIII